jgi:hypothetical protein
MTSIFSQAAVRQHAIQTDVSSSASTQEALTKLRIAKNRFDDLGGLHFWGAIRRIDKIWFFKLPHVFTGATRFVAKYGLHSDDLVSICPGSRLNLGRVGSRSKLLDRFAPQNTLRRALLLLHGVYGIDRDHEGPESTLSPDAACRFPEKC